MEKFWKTFRRGECNELATNAPARRVFEETIGLKVLIGERPLDLASDVSRFGALRSYNGVQESGFCCLWLAFTAGADLVSNGATMSISYRQRLLRTNGESRFFYLPIFENLPRHVSTTDTRRYAITVFATGCALEVSTAGEDILVEDGKSITLAPKAGQAIRARSVLRVNKQVERPAGSAFTPSLPPKQRGSDLAGELRTSQSLVTSSATYLAAH